MTGYQESVATHMFAFGGKADTRRRYLQTIARYHNVVSVEFGRAVVVEAAENQKSDKMQPKSFPVILR